MYTPEQKAFIKNNYIILKEIFNADREDIKENIVTSPKPITEKEVLIKFAEYLKNWIEDLDTIESESKQKTKNPPITGI